MSRQRSDVDKSCEPVARVVILGASNVTRSVSTLVETLGIVLGGPLEIMFALGHGRSYGIDSRVLGRQLPGITNCGLWDALAVAPPRPTYALITDIGNDILYEAPTSLIGDWVRLCLERLAAVESRTIVTALPLANLETLSASRFRLFRTVIFPRSRLQLDDVATAAANLDQLVARSVSEHNATRVVPRREWYGLDPIHVKMRDWATSWQEILSIWASEEKKLLPARGSLKRWLYLRRLRPETWRMWGISRHCAQPCGRLRDGSTIALY